MFISEHCFIQLAKRQIKRLKDPSIHFVDTIKNLLLEIVDYCTHKVIENEKNRFPRLYKRINKVACDTVNQRLQPTKSFVEKIVDMQINYINIRHPDFNLDRLIDETSRMLSYSDDSRSRTSTAATAPPPPRQPLLNGTDDEVEDFLRPSRRESSLEARFQSLRDSEVAAAAAATASGAEKHDIRGLSPPPPPPREGSRYPPGQVESSRYSPDQTELEHCIKLRKLQILR